MIQRKAAQDGAGDFNAMRIATFNVQNLRLRGDRLDGARDADDPRDTGAAARRLDPLDRRLTAEIVALVDADVLAMQEVFDQTTLDHFHDHVLLPLGVAPYPDRLCLPGNDGRGLDLALMSRRPVIAARSHAAVTPRALGLAADRPDRPLFRRDALQVDLGGLTLWVVHFKAPGPDRAAAARVRRLEAAALCRLVSRAHGPGEMWLVAGDLNDPDGEALFAEGFAVDLTERTAVPDRWTYCDPVTGALSCPDRFLASPSLAARWPEAQPLVVRFGLDRSVNPEGDARLPLVGRHRPHASDHAALVVDLPGLSMEADMRFADRADAGRRLGRRLAGLDLHDPVVLALPRGGVPVAAEVARALKAPLDLIIVRKLGLPGHEELAAGALADGNPLVRVINAPVLHAAGLDEASLAPVVAQETAELARRRAVYLGDRPRASLAGRSAIVVDDGIATGATMRAALRAVRQAGPSQVVLAVPVAAGDTLARLAAEADSIVCLAVPEPFVAVGMYYADFGQTSDAAVAAALAEAAAAGRD